MCITTAQLAPEQCVALARVHTQRRRDLPPMRTRRSVGCCTTAVRCARAHTHNPFLAGSLPPVSLLPLPPPPSQRSQPQTAVDDLVGGLSYQALSIEAWEVRVGVSRRCTWD